MRILILNTDYGAFLDWLYRSNPGLPQATYAEQMRARNDSLFGVADFYSRAFVEIGWQAFDVHINNPCLQGAWAREQGLAVDIPRPRHGDDAGVWKRASRALDRLRRRGRADARPAWIEAVLAAQIENMRPDVVLNMAMSFIETGFLRRHGCLLVAGMHAAPVPESFRLEGYDLVVSSLPNLVARFRQGGVDARLWRLGFEPRVLESLSQEARPAAVDISFIGSVSRHHRRRTALLEHLCARFRVDVWGYGAETLPRTSPIRRHHHGPAWGVEMYRRLAASRVTLNCHIDMAETCANNMRLFEATGVGTLLLTDRQENLADLFGEGTEVAAYASPEECVERIAFLLEHEEERAHIAAAGQRRTLAEHSVAARIRELAKMLEERR